MEATRPDRAIARPARSGRSREGDARRGRAGARPGARAHARARPCRALPLRLDRHRVQGMSRRELTMPKLSDSMADAVIVRWLKSPGESFARGDALIEVETDKATVVYEAEVDGTIAAILVPEGGTAAVGQPIA